MKEIWTKGTDEILRRGNRISWLKLGRTFTGLGSVIAVPTYSRGGGVNQKRAIRRSERPFNVREDTFHRRASPRSPHAAYRTNSSLSAASGNGKMMKTTRVKTFNLHEREESSTVFFLLNVVPGWAAAAGPTTTVSLSELGAKES